MPESRCERHTIRAVRFRPTPTSTASSACAGSIPAPLTALYLFRARWPGSPEPKSSAEESRQGAAVERQGRDQDRVSGVPPAPGDGSQFSGCREDVLREGNGARKMARHTIVLDVIRLWHRTPDLLVCIDEVHRMRRRELFEYAIA